MQLAPWRDVHNYLEIYVNKITCIAIAIKLKMIHIATYQYTMQVETA